MAWQGMDPAAVREVADRLDREAAAVGDVLGQIDSVVSSLPGIWDGFDARNFVDWWSQQHRPAIVHVQESIAGLATSARNNATDQEDTSGTNGAAGVGGSPGTLGGWAVTEGATWGFVPAAPVALGVMGGFLSTLGDARSLEWAKGLGKVASVTGYAIDGYEISELVQEGRNEEALYQTGLLAGEVAADVAKTKGPYGYLAGLGLQSMVEIARVAPDIEWGADGLQQVIDGLPYLPEVFMEETVGTVIRIFSL